MVSKLLVTIASYLLLVGLGGAVVFPLWKKVRTHLLPLPRLRWGRWTAGEIVLANFAFILLGMFVRQALSRSGFFVLVYGKEPDLMIQVVWGNLLVLPLWLMATFYTLYSISATYPNDIGVSRSRWRANVVLGYAAFVVTAPIVLGVFAVLNFLPDVEPHEIARLGGKGTTLLEWGLILFTVAVFAPVTEEMLFRGLLQGWLRRAGLAGHVILIAIVWSWSMNLALPQDKKVQPGNEAVKKPEQKAPPAAEKKGEKDSTKMDAWQQFVGLNWMRAAVTTLLAGVYLVMLKRYQTQNLFMTEADFLPPAESAADDDEDDAGETDKELEPHPLTPAEIEARQRWEEADRQQQRRRVGLAIYGQAMAFALVHPPWPDPIALFLLALVLGWLAQRTQNLLPGLVVHGLFNTVAWLSLFLGQYLPNQDTNGNDVATALRPSRPGSIVSSVPGSWLPRLR